jgi:lambda family phage portal protein
VGIFSFLRRKPAPARAPIARSPGAVATWTGERPKVRGAGGWLGAQPSRLLADLPGGHTSAPNRDIRWHLPVLRARSRHLAQNEGHTSGFLKLLRRNVVGPKGFTLQMRVPADRGAGQDEDANRRIEAAWARWTRHGICDVTGRLSFTDVCGQVLLAVARDGEALIREHRAWPGNPHGYALEVLDVSRLDHEVNGRPDGTADGNVVRMGIEVDRYGRAAAYWLRETVPNDDPAALMGALRRRVRIPAGDIIHLFLPEWPEQVRGIPWISNGLRTLAMLDGYSEAELTAARVAAGKMGFYKLDGDADDLDGELQADGTLVQEAQAGSFELLPKGVEVESFDPQHPNAAFKDFVAAMLRGVSAGVGISYNAFANDAAGLNYSALRATELEDRDEFRTLQHWMVGAFCQRVFSAWLREVLIAGETALPIGKAWKFDAATFVPRGWQWVDPLKEVAAVEKAVALGIASRTQTVAAQGGDIEAVAADLTAEKAMFDGLLPTAAAPGAQPDPSEED